MNFSSEKIKEKLGRLLVIPNATRWNSLYDAMVVLNKTDKHQLNVLMDDLGESRFSELEIKYIKEYVEVSRFLFV